MRLLKKRSLWPFLSYFQKAKVLQVYYNVNRVFDATLGDAPG
jgi:hypothetical protein